jgi:hypothetical protein
MNEKVLITPAAGTDCTVSIGSKPHHGLIPDFRYSLVMVMAADFTKSNVIESPLDRNDCLVLAQTVSFRVASSHSWPAHVSL